MRTISVATSGFLLAGFLMLNAAAALADCTRPRPAFEIPEGSSAQQTDLDAAQTQLVSFGRKVRDYLHCLNGETSQRSIGKDEATREQLAQAHVAAHQEAASELKGLVDCYTTQLQTFKSSGGGKQKRAADCSSFITAAAQKAQNPGTKTTELVVEASGRTTEIPGGTWMFYLVRDDSPRGCSRQPGNECLYRAIHVRNDSDAVLECKAEITYAGTDNAGQMTSRGQSLVSEHETYVVLESLAKQGIDATTFDATCTPRAKLPPLNTPANCKYEVVKPVAIGDYYPPEAQQANETGPVVVEFTLGSKAANPTNIHTVASSMYSRLDRAAEKAVGDMVMSSSCGKATYRLKLNFQLAQ